MKVNALATAVNISKLEQMAQSGDLSYEDIRDTLEGEELIVTEKLDNIMSLYEQFENNEEALKKKIGELQARATMWKNQREQLRRYAFEIIQASGRKQIKTIEHTFTIKKTPDKIVVDVEPQFLPDEYFDLQSVYKAKTDAIRAAIKDGKEIEGVHVEPGSETLQIRK